MAGAPAAVSVEAVGRSHAEFRGDVHAAVDAGDTVALARLLRTRPPAGIVALEDPVNARDAFGQSPLHAAAASRNAAALAALLLRAGADPNATDDGGMTPLHAAARVGNLALAQAVVAAGASVTRPSRTGKTARDLLHDADRDAFDAAVTAGVAQRCRPAIAWWELHGDATAAAAAPPNVLIGVAALLRLIVP